MDISFDTVFDRVIGHEKGYVNDPKDPGGETNWGISKRSYPNINIRTLTREDAKGIYNRDFWIRISADSLPDGVTFQLFDFAVNSSIETAVRMFQRALGVADDGHFGPVSKRAAKFAKESDMIMLITAERMDYQTRLKNWPAHGKGWTRRNAANLRYGALDS